VCGAWNNYTLETPVRTENDVYALARILVYGNNVRITVSYIYLANTNIIVVVIIILYIL